MRILIVEDDLALGSGLIEVLRRRGWQADHVANAEDGLRRAASADVLVTDIRLPGRDGLTLLKEARKRHPSLEVIVMTGYGSIPSAVEAMRCGARTYITKPFEPEQLLLHLCGIEEVLRLREAAARSGRGQLVGSSEPMQRVYLEIDAAAGTDAPVLISGETGTGKELAARAIHALCGRREGPFVAVDLGAISRDLAESELFGHEPGAFTGSQGRRRGRFLLANGGTLFLDETNSLPLELQPKLLRAIETKEIWPLGAEKGVQTSARIIAATNERIEDQVKAGLFREDLYYRLNVLRVDMPPLRDRPEDIPQLVRILLDRMREASSGKRIEITAGALSALIVRPWPGNIRELANALERAVARAGLVEIGKEGNGCQHIQVEQEHLDPEFCELDGLTFKEAKAHAAEEWVKTTIRAALAAASGNASEAARRLKMSRTALLRLIRKHGIRRDQGSHSLSPRGDRS